MGHRQQTLTTPHPSNPLLALATALLSLVVPQARASEGWRVEAGESWTGAESLGNGVLLEGDVRVGNAWAFVPPFRAGARDRLAVGLDNTVAFGDRVRLSVAGEWLRDTTAAGEPVAGFGDLRVGTTVRLATVGPVTGFLGWEGKMPNASDAGELGTDETDFLFGAGFLARHGDFSGAAHAGLGILGNPLRFANQDDVPLLRADLAYAPGSWRARGFVSADLATSRNPARVEAGGAARLGRSWFVEIEGAAGLSPAAADARVCLRLGLVAALPGAPPGE